MLIRSRDGRWMASAQTCTIYEAGSLNVCRILTPGAGRRVSFSPDSRRLVSTDMNHRWDVYEAPQWHQIASSGQSDVVTRTKIVGDAVEAGWSPDASWFAAAGEDTDIDLVEAGTWRTMARLHGPIEIPVIDVTADGSFLVVQRRDGPVEIWNLTKLQEEMRALGMDLRLPPAVTPPPSPPGLEGPFEELVLPPVSLERMKTAK